MMAWPQKEPAESGATIVTTQESNVKHTAEGPKEWPITAGFLLSWRMASYPAEK